MFSILDVHSLPFKYKCECQHQTLNNGNTFRIKFRLHLNIGIPEVLQVKDNNRHKIYSIGYPPHLDVK